MRNLLIVAGTAVAISTGSWATAQTEITIAVPEPQSVRLAAQAFADHIEAATDGELSVRILIHDAIGGARAATDQMRLGELQFNFADAGGYAGILPDFQVFSWPFLFPSRSVFYELMLDADYVEGLNDFVAERTDDTLKFFGAGENSIRHIYTTRGPIATPADLAENRIVMRTRELTLDQQLFAALGAPQVVALPAPERYSALQTGMIDGTEGGLESAWAAGLLEVSPYVTLTGHAYDYFFLMGDAAFYDGLSDDQKSAVDEAARLMMWVNHGHKITAEAEVLEQIREAGITVVAPTPTQLAEWQALAMPVGESVVSQIVDEDFKDATLAAIERVQANLDRRAGR